MLLNIDLWSSTTSLGSFLVYATIVDRKGQLLHWNYNSAPSIEMEFNLSTR